MLQILKTFPFTEDTPPGDTIREDQASPGTPFSDFNDRFPDTTVSCSIGP